MAAAASREWEPLAGEMRVAKLTPPLCILVPALAFPSVPKGTRGFTLPTGRAGKSVGALLLAAGALVGYLLLAPVGVLGLFVSLWLISTAGGAMLWAAHRPTAFVKPICVACRLLPVIKEHEAMHLTGVSSEKAVWDSMRTRHSVDTLALDADPAICPFCPIPKRLAGR